MKIFIVIALALTLATPAVAFTGPVGVPNSHGVGLGAFPLVRWGMQQLRHLPPMFVFFDFGGQDEPTGTAREGRSDTYQMYRHQAAVDALHE